MALILGAQGAAIGEDGTLTEAEAVSKGLSRPAVEDLVDGATDLARADAIEAGLWPNPSVSYSREQTYGRGGSAEDYAWLSQALDFSGRRGLRRRAAEQRVAATSDDRESQQLQIEADVRDRFYTVLQLQLRVGALEHWVQEIGRAGEAVQHRAAAGDVSGYDRRRVERERATFDARLGTEEAALARSRERLAAIIEAEPPAADLRVAGTLAPPGPPPPVDDLVAQLDARPDLRAIAENAEAAGLEMRAAGRWWLPEFAIGGGLKTVEIGGERFNGFLASVTVPLPLLNRHQGDALRAASRARIARGRLSLERAEAAAQVRGLWVEATRIWDAARRFRTDAGDASQRLVRTADAGYRAGEMSILELLDAYRAAIDAESQSLDLELSARRARIELDRATGGASR
jgi:outer membrane protein, heavy metal efflux system